MMLFALAALQAAPARTVSSPDLIAPYRACVLSKAAEWGKSREQAKVVVETALGACTGQRDIVRKAAVVLVKEEGGRSYAEVQEMADTVLVKVDAQVSNLAYQEVIKSRMPR